MDPSLVALNQFALNFFRENPPTFIKPVCQMCSTVCDNKFEMPPRENNFNEIILCHSCGFMFRYSYRWTFKQWLLQDQQVHKKKPIAPNQRLRLKLHAQNLRGKPIPNFWGIRHPSRVEPALQFQGNQRNYPPLGICPCHVVKPMINSHRNWEILEKQSYPNPNIQVAACETVEEVNPLNLTTTNR